MGSVKRAQAPVTIYGLVDPRDGRVRYVGKTTWALSHRLRGHIGRARSEATHKGHWISALLAQGLRPRIVALETLPADSWQDAERGWIAWFGDSLTNTTVGGEVGGWGYQRGEKCPSAKLTETDVVAISERFAAGGVTLRQLADEYGVTVKAISFIVRGINWRHVDRPLTFRASGAKGVSRNKGNRHGAKDYRR